MNNALKFTLPVFVLPFLVISGIIWGGWWSFYAVLVAFGLIPFLELFLKGNQIVLLLSVLAAIVWYFIPP